MAAKRKTPGKPPRTPATAPRARPHRDAQLVVVTTDAAGLRVGAGDALVCERRQRRAARKSAEAVRARRSSRCSGMKSECAVRCRMLRSAMPDSCPT